MTGETASTQRKARRRGEGLPERLLHQTAAAEERFRGLVEVAPDAIVTVDGNGRIVLVNGEAERLFGYSREEMLGASVEMLLPERFREAHAGHRLAYGRAPRIRPMGANLELTALRKDGSEVPVEISLGPLQVDDGLLVVAAIRDSTQRKQTEAALQAAREEAERANQAKSEFLSRMSHELRTPLNSILGFGQLLTLEPLNPEQRDALDHILRAGRHLLALINEVLDISRIETGRMALSPEPVLVEEVLRETLELARPLAMERGITLQEAEGCGDCYVIADRQRLRQALLNLVSNAIKYNRERGSVRIACSPAPDEPEMLRIAVIDTGPGISPEMQARLFTPFDRLGAEQTGVEGTGLGLTLSQRLVEAMGGRLGVTSQPGEGSTFWIDLALTESSLAREERLRGRTLDVTQGRLSRSRTVLYIEDNVDSARLVERIFSRWAGVRLIAAMQGRLGLDLARQHRPDLVLLDLHLPDISGLEVLRRLRAHPATRDIPVVITSADATPGQVERLLRAGADEYLTKPLDVEKFAEVVRRKLE